MRRTISLAMLVALVGATMLLAGCFDTKGHDEIRYYESVLRQPNGAIRGVHEITHIQAKTQQHWRFHITEGRAEHMALYNDAGRLVEEVRVRFDDRGRVVEERTSSPGRTLTAKLEIAYDDHDRVVGFKRFTADAGLTEEREWVYDEQGRMTRVRVIGPGGILRWRDEFVYDRSTPAKLLGVRRYGRDQRLIEQIPPENYSFWE